MFDIVSVLVLALLAAVFGWLATRARTANHPVLKWGGLLVSGLLTFIFGAAVLVAGIGFYRLNFSPGRPPVADVTVARTTERVARGERFAVLCPLCHSPNGKAPLVGQNFGKDGPPVGTIYAANLTPAGEINGWSDGEVIRAIREGVHKSGRPLVIMPSEVFHNLSDTDVQAIVAYLRSQPAVQPSTPPTKLNVVAALFIGSGVFQTSAQVPITQPIVAPTEGASADYDKYLVSILGCRLCHGENLAGRKPGGDGPPAGPNLTLIVPRWTEEAFIRTLRTGVDPYRHTLAAGMPWQAVSAFAGDDDLRAIHAYLHALTPLAGPLK
jgi:mono/diheme cytochrome c family protein